eukprot:1185666-Prorocentrum_minimum.AAC.1
MGSNKGTVALPDVNSHEGAYYSLPFDAPLLGDLDSYPIFHEGDGRVTPHSLDGRLYANQELTFLSAFITEPDEKAASSPRPTRKVRERYKRASPRKWSVAGGQTRDVATQVTVSLCRAPSGGWADARRAPGGGADVVGGRAGGVAEPRAVPAHARAAAEPNAHARGLHERRQQDGAPLQAPHGGPHNNISNNKHV